MNANELADELQELDSKLHLIELFKSATMLRQQQAEIEALKERVAEDDDDEPYKEVRPWTPEEIDYLRKWAIEGDLKNAKTLLEQAGYKVQEPNK